MQFHRHYTSSHHYSTGTIGGAPPYLEDAPFFVCHVSGLVIAPSVLFETRNRMSGGGRRKTIEKKNNRIFQVHFSLDRGKKGTLRPILIQSNPVSRKRPLSTGLLFDWILLGLHLIVSRVDSLVLVLFIGMVGVREYCCIAVWQSKIDWKLCASCVLR